MTPPHRPHARSSFAAALVASALLLSGCAGSGGTDTPDVAEGTPAATSPEHDLRFVSPTAPACTVAWTAGATLPENYEWCSDEEGNPVAGVRIGSCEVVIHAGEMYAVPGERITAAIGPLAHDPQFTDMLTACKRRPARTP